MNSLALISPISLPMSQAKRIISFYWYKAVGKLPPGWLDLKWVKYLHKVSWQQFPSVWGVDLEVA